MKLSLRHELWAAITHAKSVVPQEPAISERRPRECKHCGTVGSIVHLDSMIIHRREAGRVVEVALPSRTECRFCHHGEDRV